MKKVTSFRRVVSLLFVLIIFAALCAPAFASTTDKPRLVDSAQLLSSSEQAALTSKLEQVSRDNNIDVVVVTVYDEDLYYSQMTAAADDYYDYSGYSDDGLLLLYNSAIDVNEKNTWISTKGSAIDALEDEDIQKIGKKIKPMMKEGRFYDAFDKFADMVGDEYNDYARSKTIKLIIGILVCLVIGIVIAGIVAISVKSKYKPVRMKAEANDYLVSGSFKLSGSYDRFIYSHVSRTRRSKDNDSGSSTHTSSSGSSHGGGGF